MSRTLFALASLTSLLAAQEPPAHLADWVRQDQADPLEPGAVVFIGSSSIRRWESLHRDFPQYRIVQRGWGGSWLAEMDDAAPFILFPLQPSAIVMWAGTNDLTNGHSGEEVHEDFLRFHRLLRQTSPELPFLFLGMTRTPANGSTTAARDTANRLIRETLEKDPHARFIDFPAFFDALGPTTLDALYVDPVHLNPDGYAEWVRMLAPELAATVAPNLPAFSNPEAPAPGATLYLDFGPPPTATDTPHRNALFPDRPGATLRAGEHQAVLVDREGNPTGVRLTLTGDFHSDPDGAGIFSTGDHLKGAGNDDLPGAFLLTGLDPALPCEIRLTGHGGSADAVTDVTAYGRGIDTLSLATGTGKTGILPQLWPDAHGRIWIDLNLLAGNRTALSSVEIHLGSAAK